MKQTLMKIVFAVMVMVSGPTAWARMAQTPPELLTVAEKSDYTATARYADVVELCDRIAQASGGRATRLSMGVTEQGRDLPMLVLADPPIETAAEARRSGKLVVMLFGNIHAGEVCGKEALPMLAREWLGLDGQPATHELFKELIVVIVPIYNADGNENLGPIDVKRAGQNGPAGGDGVGTRENSNGLDLNRDYVKLEAAETRAMIKFFVEWDPAVVVDTHTTNGSHHRYTITYAGPTNPAGDAGVLEYVRDSMLPDLAKRCKNNYNLDTFYYGNFEKNHTTWTTFPDFPRYGTGYIGMRGRIGLLSEAYAYAPFKDRVLSTRDFCREIVAYSAENAKQIRELVRGADERAASAGRAPKPDDQVPLRSEAAPLAGKFTALGFEEETRDGKVVATDRAKDYEVELINDFKPTLTTRRPYAYLIPREDRFAAVITNLQRHGIKVEQLREDIELDVETMLIESVTKAMRPFQGHDLVDVKVSSRAETFKARAGMYVVRTGQPLGNLTVYILEPASADGLTVWNFFDDSLVLGAAFPVVRVVEPVHVLTGPIRPLGAYRTLNKAITSELVESGDSPNFSGTPIGRLRWVQPREAGAMSDAAESSDEYYTAVHSGTLHRINARTGRAEPAWNLERMSAALAVLPTVGESAAKSLVGPSMNMNSTRSAAMVAHENDLYYATLDGTAVRLTSSPEPEEFPTFSPDGEFVAFVRNNDLWVVDVRTQRERALTTGGTDLIRNAKNDWVYFEELYGRNWKAFWWSPDSKRIAFLQVDSTQVPRFKLQADHAEPRIIEDTPYPEPGEPNPHVRLGIVTASGGSVRWTDLSDYNAGHYLITGVGWFAEPAGLGPVPETKAAWCYVQNRVQTWMDLLSIPVSGAKPTRLMRETTQAWVEPQGEPRVLKDGSFILASERTGYRHLYLFDKQGKLINPITQGDWEARSIEHVDEGTGFVYLMGTADGSVGQNLYRVKLDGSDFQRLTRPFVTRPQASSSMDGLSEAEQRLLSLESPAPDRGGIHTISFSPSGKLYLDTWSDYRTPPQVGLFSADGEFVRAIDTNPVYTHEEYNRGQFAMFHVPARDGFVMEASVLLPPDFDPAQRYPVWLMTYAGPHAPTVSDSWAGGRLTDEALANMGLIVFRVDPRSASGKGAVSAWSAYKQLGVQELMDLEDAVQWLAQRPYVDASRVGISGGSYGGFMTAYALTHSKVFAAGVASASVTDWRDYDSIYTERYMLMPQDNIEGYEATSVVGAAKNLHGKLLLVHGTMDDNVHMLNSLKLVRAMQNANKQFEFMLYPGSRHGIGGNHYRRLFREFIQRTFELNGTSAEPESINPPSTQSPRRKP